MTLKEKYGGWALITGASAGIGEEFAKRFASEKMNLVLVARRKERLDKLAADLKSKHGVEIVTVQADLADEKFLTGITNITFEKEISILVNNAGFGYNGEFVNSDLRNQTDIIKVNCIAPVVLTHHFLKGMIERKNGAVIFLGSLVGYQPTPFTTVYSSTKAFNLFMGEALWYELRRHNIDVLVLNPGGTSTEFQKIAGTSAGPAPRNVSQVVDTAMKHLGKKMSVVDGAMNKIISAMPRIMTRKFTVRIAGTIRKKYFT